MAIKVLIYWLTANERTIEAIRKRFNVPRYSTLNGWTPAEIAETDIEVFKETAKRGFIRYRKEEWTFNGHTYSW